MFSKLIPILFNRKIKRFVEEYGIIRYRLLGKLHREDGPAVEYPNGDKEWYRHGLRHRDDGPSSTHASGFKEWRYNGKRHRDDGPAIIYEDGHEEWYRHGIKVTERGPIEEKPPSKVQKAEKQLRSVI